jgi:cation diffusion facilitator family transporter
MAAATIHRLQHGNDFSGNHRQGERRALLVLFLTAVTMLVEITAGIISGSMALLADGWHMGTHMAALSITLFAYWYAGKHSSDPQFTLGTGKVGVLGGFSSAITLLFVALVMAGESVVLFFNPGRIHFDEALIVAFIGLVVNIICAIILSDNHAHGHNHHQHDHNLKAAYLHIIADALTSVLAIIALFAGKFTGIVWLDPVMGITGSLVIGWWSWGLLRETSPVLLDRNPDSDSLSAIRTRIESDADNRILDLHLWKIGPDDYSVYYFDINT